MKKILLRLFGINTDIQTFPEPTGLRIERTVYPEKKLSIDEWLCHVGYTLNKMRRN